MDKQLLYKRDLEQADLVLGWIKSYFIQKYGEKEYTKYEEQQRKIREQIDFMTELQNKSEELKLSKIYKREKITKDRKRRKYDKPEIQRPTKNKRRTNDKARK